MEQVDNNGRSESFDTTCLFIFDPLESISDELEPELCALSEYGLANGVSVFVRE